MGKLRKAEVLLEFQNYIENPPVPAKSLWEQACSNDEITVSSWRDIWIKNYKSNSAKYGPFKDKSVASIFGTEKYKPTIIAGSGPSLKRNIEELKNNKDICVVSCLHNFHFMEDNNIKVKYYVTLDAGDVTVEEVSEGGSKTPDEYWDITKDRTLIAYAATSPLLLEKWKGTVLFYNGPVPDEAYVKAIDEIDPFHIYCSTGGNVLGACLYIAKAILLSNPIAFIGADFSFSYDHKFHGWNSKYDANLGNVVKAVDVFGNKVLTWQSYHNFKGWFEWVTLQVPGLYVNCTEGGIFGSYPQGNIMAVKQMQLEDFLITYEMGEHLRDGMSQNDGVIGANGKVQKQLLF